MPSTTTRPLRIVLAAAVAFATVAAVPVAEPSAPACRLTAGPATHQPYMSVGVAARPGRVRAVSVAECVAFHGSYDIVVETVALHRGDAGLVEEPGSRQQCRVEDAQGYTATPCSYVFEYDTAPWAAQEWRVCTRLLQPRALPESCTTALTTP